MPLDEETQAAITAAVEAAMAPVIKAANEAVEGLSKKNRELLHETKQAKAAAKSATGDANYQQAMRAADKFLAGDTDSIPDGALRTDDTNLYVARSKVLDPAEYRRLKTVAAEQGKTLQIMDDMTNRTSVADQPVIHEFEHKGTTYLSAARIEEMGGPNAYARLRSENPTKKYHAFRDLNGVSAEVREAHDAAMGADDD